MAWFDMFYDKGHDNHSMMRHYFNKKAQVLIDQALYSGTSFLLTILMARHFSASDFGIFSAYVLFSYLAVSMVAAWTLQVFQVMADIDREYVSFVFWLQLLLVFLCSVVVKLLFGLFSEGYVYVSVYYGASFLMYDFGRRLFLALDKTLWTLYLDVFTGVSIMYLLFYFIHEGSKDLVGLLCFFTYVYICSLGLIVLLLRPFSYKKEKWGRYYKDHLRHGKWLFLSAASQWWAGNLYVVAAGVHLGSAALGALRLAQSLFGVLNLLMQTYENYVLPKIALEVHRDMASGMQYVRATNQRLALVFVPVICFVFVFATPFFVMTGGKQYAPYGFVLKGFSILYLLILLSQPIRFVFRSLHFNQHFFYA